MYKKVWPLGALRPGAVLLATHCLREGYSDDDVIKVLCRYTLENYHRLHEDNAWFLYVLLSAKKLLKENDGKV